MADLVKANIYQKMTLDLKCAMTTWREDNDLPAMSEEAIEEFLATNRAIIELAASDMYDAYSEDNDLAELGDGSGGCNDWYREYLYERVTPPDWDEL